MRKLTRSFSYAFFSNIVSLLVSTILIIIVPRYISVEKYGFWQLYTFYSSYTSYLSFGLTDGIYLKVVGEDYEQLNKNELKSQTIFLFLSNITMLVMTYLFLGVNAELNLKTIILLLSLVSAILLVPRSLFTFVLQATNRIKEYSIILLIEKITYFVLVVLLLFVGIKNVIYLIVVDLLAKIVSYTYVYLQCKDIFSAKLVPLKNTISLAIDNIRVGSKLLIANLSSMLIIGILRFSIERVWDIATFGKVSLTLSISNMIMIFINSVAIVILPVIKKVNSQKLPKIFFDLRLLLTAFLFFLLLGYFPLTVVIEYILPKYIDSIKFIAILFPMCIFEGKMAMLINTYMKALRYEGKLMYFNFCSVVLSSILALVFAFGLKNLNLTVLSILASLAFKEVIAEKFLSKRLKLKINSLILTDLVMTMIFIFCAWVLPFYEGLVLYLIVLTIYIVLNYKKIKSSYALLRKY